MNDGINRGTHRRKSSWRSHAEVISLQSQSQVDCAQSLQNLVGKARLGNIHKDSKFDANYWSIPSRARASSAGEGGIHFTIENAGKGKQLPPFPEPFLSFMKAVVTVYDARTVTGYSASQLQALVAAGRWLFKQFGIRDPDPCALVHGDFERAARDAQSAMGEGAVNIGSKLGIIAQIIDDHGISFSPIEWRNPLKRSGKHTQIGPVADRRRDELMPSNEVLDALAQISARTDLDVRDLIIQRTIDLLVCGGFRINEVLTMPRDCLYTENELDDHGRPVLDRFGQPVERVGLRYWPEKGSTETRMKWIPSVMNEIVKRAINDIIEITKPSWKVARYQFDNPDTTLLPEAWHIKSPDDIVTCRQIEQMLGLATRGGDQFLRENNIPSIDIIVPKKQYQGAKEYTVKGAKLRDVGAALYRKSESGNVLRRAEGKQMLHECLFLVPKFFVKRSMNNGIAGTVTLLKDAIINVYLVGFQTTLSIFERLEYTGSDGETLRTTSHAFRHWLNTIALEGGLSDVELARWMGRKMSQNGPYDHRSPVQRAMQLGNKLRARESLGPVAEATLSIRDPIRREEFISSLHGTAHITDLGICVHPWDSLPCEKHGACFDCAELRIVKGDSQALSHASDQLKKTQAELAAAQAEQSDGGVIAGRWVDAHKRAIGALEKILSIHNDPSVPEGTIVQKAKASE